ncbi:2-C-methyl-D-erythritol 4-phosphate cytidylyltransferase, partial [Simkania negevensis]|nr:2-C-methyl-D-erythritol 4-phosphate cytidylyltransferase [Simkania negevensis]
MTSAVLLSGGHGARMNHTIPKQYIDLGGKPVVLWSLEVLLATPSINEVIIVCHPNYQILFSTIETNKTITFALPGRRRQDSLYNGLQETRADTDLVCVHDSARPFIRMEKVEELIEAGRCHGAAVLGIPVHSTIKEADGTGFVINTLDRAQLWMIQTPQVATRELFERGFAAVNEAGLTVTDDVALVEKIGHPVKIVPGTEENIKITTPHDFVIAQHI